MPQISLLQQRITCRCGSLFSTYQCLHLLLPLSFVMQDLTNFIIGKRRKQLTKHIDGCPSAVGKDNHDLPRHSKDLIIWASTALRWGGFVECSLDNQGQAGTKSKSKWIVNIFIQTALDECLDPIFSGPRQLPVIQFIKWNLNNQLNRIRIFNSLKVYRDKLVYSQSEF